MLQEVDRDIWIADGPSVPFLGIPYPTRMILVRLSDRTLWVCSPIRSDDSLWAAVNELGPVTHLVSPNKLHHLFLGDWARRWPEAKLYASPGLARRRRDLSFAAALADRPEPAWEADIDQVIFRGSFAMEEVVFFHRASRTAIFTDLIQKFDPATLHGWRNLLMKLDGLVGPEGSTPREWRLSFVNRKAARRALHKSLEWNPRRLIVAHGAWARENGREVIQRSLRWLA
ncbi:MAG: DUF4336 domain-containing protein [Candidatus Binatia bacterium]